MKAFFKSVFASALGTVLGLGLLFFSGMLLMIVIATLSSNQMGEVGLKQNSILYFNLKGRIIEQKGSFFADWAEDSPFFSGPRTHGLFEMLESLRKGKTDAKVRGAYIKLGDLDCGWASIEALRRAFIDFKSEGKFVHVYAENYDERTYYLATVADKIYVYPEGSFEFNGIGVVPLFVKGTLEKLGITPQIFKVGEFKSAVEIFSQDRMSRESREQTSELINDLWNVFIQEVGKARNLEASVLNKLAADLEITRADQAIEKGLVDEPVAEEQVLELLRGLTHTKSDQPAPLVSYSSYFHKLSEPAFNLSHKKRIAVIFAEGEIISGNSSDEYIGSDDLVKAMREVAREKDIKGLVIRVNSPGGSALASDVIWRQTLEVKKTKPVVASFGDVAASGGYYLSAGADFVYAEPNTLTGSIGVFGVMFTTQEFFNQKLGITFDRVLTHPYADIGDGSRNMNDFERNRIQAEVEKTYQQFLRVVKQGRNYQSPEEVDNVARGRVWSGIQAQQNGLVDERGGLYEALDKIAEVAQLGDDWEVEVFPREKSPFEQFMEAFGETSLFKKLVSLQQPVEELAKLWARLPQWQRQGGILALDPQQFVIR
ncbi:MAG: signal peptide peptidase SppA [Bdellovibrionales bacterium]|nr:signal peptide peptidase SppA [Bdellovibrionales bacterium]